MVLELGENPSILIVLIFLELLLIILPAFIASKVEKKSFKDQLKDMGFNKDSKSFTKIMIEVIIGIDIGIFLFLIADFILFFFINILIENIFGIKFVKKGSENIISTIPIQPSLIEVVIIIVLQIIIIGPCEEGFFRGFIIKKFNQKINLFFSMIISSVFFAIYHVPPFIVPLSTIITFFGYYFTLGLIFATIFIISRNSIISCSIAHSVFNIIVLII